jgi:hypothetical protein
MTLNIPRTSLYWKHEAGRESPTQAYGKAGEVASRYARTLPCCLQRDFAAWLCGWTSRQYDLHKLLYANTCKVFELTAQAAVRCIAKVADAYAAQKTRVQRSRLHSRSFSQLR